jgi:putative ATPase
VPAHLRGTGYAGAAKLGHGEGYRYSHDEPAGVGPQQYLPDDLVDADYYHPTDRGWEERLGPRWRQLRGIIRGDPPAG